MSVVYGADALAGVINIITKKSTKTMLSVSAVSQEKSIGKKYGIDQGIHNHSVGLNAYFGGWRGDATRLGPPWHKKVQQLSNGSIGWKIIAIQFCTGLMGWTKKSRTQEIFCNISRDLAVRSLTTRSTSRKG